MQWAIPLRLQPFRNPPLKSLPQTKSFTSDRSRASSLSASDSHDEMDRVLMPGLPMAHNLEFEEILPVREYDKFAEDIKRRWK